MGGSFLRGAADFGSRDAGWVRVCLEQRSLTVRCRLAWKLTGSRPCVQSPQVYANRNQNLLWSLESDAIELAATAELLIRADPAVTVPPAGTDRKGRVASVILKGVYTIG